MSSNSDEYDEESARCSKLKIVAKRALSSKVLKPILYGQILSLLICGTAITSTYLVVDYNADIPLTQSLCNYLLLASVYGTLFIIQKDGNNQSVFLKTVKTVGWKYLILAIADVCANFFIVKAYQYTSLTSVQVLDCFVIPVVMILSWFVLKTRYKIPHYIGVGIALLGVTVMIIADVVLGKSDAGSSPLLGDFLVLAGATCYGLSNVGMEYFMKARPQSHTEVLAMYGILGTTICGIMVAALERDALKEVVWSLASVGFLIGFTICMFVLYTCMPLVMKLSSATTVNLSILTADLYALFAGIFLFGYKFTPLYIISFIVIFLSLIIYNSMPPGTAAGRDGENVERRTDYVHGLQTSGTELQRTPSSTDSTRSTSPLQPGAAGVQF